MDDAEDSSRKAAELPEGMRVSVGEEGARLAADRAVRAPSFGRIAMGARGGCRVKLGLQPGGRVRLVCHRRLKRCGYGALALGVREP
jgi:hypothetical protein